MKKYFEMNLYGEPEKLRAKHSRYSDGTDAIEIICWSKEFNAEEPYARLTVNTGTYPPRGTVWAKTWSENEEMFQKLCDEGYLEPTKKTIQCGYAEAIACKLTDKFKAFVEVDGE